MPDIYIHYGAVEFNPAKGFPIQNREFRNKPKGGLWASRLNATSGWKWWCERRGYADWLSEESLQFIFKNPDKVYRIFTPEDLYFLPRLPTVSPLQDEICIDFETCMRIGLDAIELCYYGKEFNEHPSYSLLEDNLYSLLYGWDCDSVVVLNPDSIEVIESA